MARALLKNANGSRSNPASKYDANNTVLSKTYGVLADLRRELADSKEAIGEREELLKTFALCADSQRAWLLLEDYFEKLSLSRKDFPTNDWWPRLLGAQKRARLEELAFLFLRARRSLPTELSEYANLERFAAVEQAAHEQQVVRSLEEWLFPPKLTHLDAPRASLRVLCSPQPDADQPFRFRLGVHLRLMRPRSGEKARSVREIVELTTRAAHEQEQFPQGDWEFIQWLAEVSAGRAEAKGSKHGESADNREMLLLSDLDLLHWLTRWGHTSRLELESPDGGSTPIEFLGQVAEFTPHLENGDKELSFTHRLTAPGGHAHKLGDARFFVGRPPLALVGHTFYLLRNAPPAKLLEHWTHDPSVPVRKLSHRLLMHLRRTQANHGVDWEQLVVTHPASPEFVFELVDETVRLRLLAKSERDGSRWIWNGHEWLPRESAKASDGKPEILDDPRLEPATHWLRKIDWFTPEPGLWVGDANESFLNLLSRVWPERPPQAAYLGNPAFHRLFLAPRKLKPRL
ncbi:MAG TPA: ATP-dependent helicase, partial [Verrucomicrobiae bacterium]|nr:ATP-dependent helicase [Verrucomicrobiae bacterium]